MKARIRQVGIDILAILVIAIAWVVLFSLACGGLGVLIDWLIGR